MELSSLAEPRNGHTQCWPANFRDWLAAHCVVRFGRLDRYDAVRATRSSLAGSLAHGGSLVEFATPYGFTAFLPYRDKNIILMALNGMMFHRKVIDLFLAVIRPGDIVVDGGSNIGFFSLLAASLLKGSGRVFSFEPDPDIFSVLEKNVERNGFLPVVRLEEKALTNATGNYDFNLVVGEPMLNSLIPRTDAQTKTVRVSGVRLDDYLAGSGQHKVDLIKLDLEGAEPMALDGMRASLRTARVAIFEINEPQLVQMNVEPVALIDQTVKAGDFDSVLFIDEQRERFCQWDPADFLQVLHDYKFVNVVCAKQGCIPVSIAT